jgi:hypothetical protein
MKNQTLFYLLLLPLTIALTACPVETQVPLGSKGTEKIDPALLGIWELQDQDEDADIQKVEITRENEYQYNVSLTETGDEYDGDDSFTGYVTKIDGKKFAYFESAEGSYFLYSYQIKDKLLTTYEISLDNPDGIKTTQELRTKVSAAVKAGTGLTEATNWVKSE